MKRIIVTISPTGVPVIEADGFADASCKAATQPLIDALAGGKVDGISGEDKFEASIPATSASAGTALY